ncbi:acyl-CoA carboxylase subunit epsilon [Streptomyces sp. NPDC058664]|uniref:acyl-CoA carboxylase subunit epsilon n=1 Tax=unclassified Streptomyces TaxID=2593676 RepID=UPI00365748F3
MSAPGAAGLTVVRGNPTPEELAGLLVVLAALRGAGGEADVLPDRGRGWGRPAGWQRPQSAAAPDAAGWQRTFAPTQERTIR